jgi:hypothetical protein
MTPYAANSPSTALAPESAWHKSSYSRQNNGDCVEIAALPNGEIAIRDSKHTSGPALRVPPQAWSAFVSFASSTALAPPSAWHTSSYSGPNNGTCVEVAALPTGEVGIRDSKDTSGPALRVPPAAWTAFLTLARADTSVS